MICISDLDAPTSNKSSTYIAKIILFLAKTLNLALIGRKPQLDKNSARVRYHMRGPWRVP